MKLPSMPFRFQGPWADIFVHAFLRTIQLLLAAGDVPTPIQVIGHRRQDQEQLFLFQISENDEIEFRPPRHAVPSDDMFPLVIDVVDANQKPVGFVEIPTRPKPRPGGPYNY